ncbi:hypothetical protein KUV95_12520 [Microbulbifer agarilyticus]|uniref:hypothetical protein n=1 Tax=Microbulbifer agarilyticus TaxID=260552 RepID=UPI001C95AEEE|nr:hypothetical protein [Microbulbifer agarilyticus]MBY6212375.1 hypothetical protein [Microbulbifer agarilyticus]
MRNIPVGTWLDCGCCGTWFETWEGYVDQDQDEGYGICRKCQGEIREHDEAEWDKAIATLREGLNDQNRAKFDAMPRIQQKAMVWDALDKGILTYHIVPRV